MTRDERPLSQVPAALWAALVALLAAQVAWQSAVVGRPARSAEDLPPAPRESALRLAALGEPEAGARLAMLYLQAFDLGGANALPYRALDYGRLTAWLESILALDPRSEYPLFSAARVYAEVPDPAKSRVALEFIHRAFLKDPGRRWPWLAHAALIAKHRLGDLQLALRYAQAIDRETAGLTGIPSWARQMQVFILEDLKELDAAKIMLGGLLESGRIQDPAERRFLAERLRALEDRQPSKNRQPRP